MRITTLTAGAGLFAVCFMLPGDADAGRFGGGGRGGGAARGGGFQGGGGYHAAPMSRPAPSFQANPAQHGTVHGPYGGTATGGRQTGTVAGPRGSGTVGRGAGTYTGPHGGQAVGVGRGGSFTTQGGYTINRGSGATAYTGPHGGVYVGRGQGTTVTGPGGNTVGGANRSGVVIGPNGNVHAGGASAAGVKTPTGSAVAGSRAGVTAGPGGVAVTGARGGVATGPGGTVAAGSRGGVAVGPYGAVAGGRRAAVGVSPYGVGYAGTRYVGASTLHNQGYYVRQGYGYYNRFTPGWYARYPGAWYTAGLIAGSAWAAASWGTAASYSGYPESTAPVDYDYGNTVTYQDGNVYYGDQVAGTEAQYAEQAQQIADAGSKSQPAADEKWQPLGVFAMVAGDETTSNDIFQLALNKDGVVRGNYYNAKTDTATPAAGSLDKKTQRVAWTVGDKKDVVYEAGLYNLTKEETTLLVHFGKDRTEQYRLFRIEQPKDGDGAAPMK